MIRRSAYAALVLFACTLRSAAQDAERTAGPAVRPDSIFLRNSAGILFDRNLNTFTWNGRALIDTAVAGVRVAVDEQYTSSVVSITSRAAPTRRLETDRQNLALRLSHQLDPALRTEMHWTSSVFTDNRGVALGNASMHNILGGLRYTPFGSLTLIPLAGYRWDNQASVRDRGLSYTLAATADDIDVDGYQFSGNAQYHEDRLSPRRLESHFGKVGVRKQFSAMTRDTLEVQFQRNRREFYMLTGNAIESRRDNVFSFTNLLDYSPAQQVLASFYFTVTNRALDKRYRDGAPLLMQNQLDTHIDELRLSTFLQAVYLNDDGHTAAVLRLAYAERNEAHKVEPMPGIPERIIADRNAQEQSRDNTSRQTTVTGSFNLPVSGSDTVAVAGAATILRYDTPSSANSEDRDELLVAASVATSHRLSPYLLVGITLEGSLSHLVYLLSDRSANNNYNRVLRLSPRTIYRPVPWLSTTNIFEVLANYTVYDFEQQLPSVHSFAYRQFAWIDSTQIELTHRIGLDYFSYFKFYERGQLRWQEFTERPENYVADRTIAASLRFSPYPGFRCAAGFRYFGQTRYQYQGSSRRVESFLRSIGPTCDVLWDISPYSRFSLQGWYEQRRLPDGSRESIPGMTMNVLLHF